MGRLGADPELRRTGTGIAVTSFRIATTRDYVPQGQERETDWFDVVAWRNTAEFVARNFTKGRVIVIKGRLETRKWTDKNGNERTSTEVLAENVYFGDSKKDGSNAVGGYVDNYSQLPDFDETAPDPIDIDEELPF
jgi:single-strand DNA-binding protein